MVQSQTKEKNEPKSERIEFARVYGSRLIPHIAGEPFPPYPERDLDAWQSRTVNNRIGSLLRELSRRGPHGVSIKKVDHDDLAELSLLGVPFKLTDWDKTNTWAKKLFVVVDVLLRFPEDHAAAALTR